MSEKTSQDGNIFRVDDAVRKADEEAYDYAEQRSGSKSNGTLGTIVNLVKGGLGAGILAGHVSYMRAGVYPAVLLTFLTGIYMGYCLYILVRSARIIYCRTGTYDLTYSDVGEAAMALCPSEKVAKYSTLFRYAIDIVICFDLFGACAVYQLIIAKTIKQLVENQQITDVEPQIPGYPNLRVYIACMIVPVVLICLLTELKYLTPFSLLGNIFIISCILITVYYSLQENPKFEGMKPYGTFYEVFEFLALSVFSMSFAGIVLPVTNTMKKPNQLVCALSAGNGIIVLCVFTISFFGYNAYLENSQIPITINFPMTLIPKILKDFVAAMVYITHALNFYVPFHLCWHYIKKLHNPDPDNLLKWELFYRTLFVILIGMIAIAFPDLEAIMGFIGAFCISNMAFVWPNVIEILVIWKEPGFGKYKWRLWKSLLLIFFGLVLMAAGSIVTFFAMIKRKDVVYDEIVKKHEC